MDLFALMTLGFLGLTPGGSGGGEPIPVGVPAYGDFNSPVGWSLPDKPQAPAGAGIFVQIHIAADFPFLTIVADDGKNGAGG